MDVFEVNKEKLNYVNLLRDLRLNWNEYITEETERHLREKIHSKVIILDVRYLRVIDIKKRNNFGETDVELMTTVLYSNGDGSQHKIYVNIILDVVTNGEIVENPIVRIVEIK